MKQITLEDYLLDAMAKVTKSDMKALMSNLEINLTNKFERTAEAVHASEFAKKVIGIYGGIYNAMKTKMRDEREDKKNQDEFFRAYWTYIAAEGCLDILGKTNSSLMVKSMGRRIPAEFNLGLSMTDNSTLGDALKHYYKFILNSLSAENVNRDTKAYFQFLSNVAAEKMEGPLLSRYKEKYKDITIVGKNFKVEGIKESKKKLATKSQGKAETPENFNKGLEEITLKPVKREEIVGNQEAIDLVETEVPCLMYYDPQERRNPFEGFQQYMLFAGRSGTGKTMLARYAMTIASEIAEKSKKPVSLVKLNFEDKFQCGPLENIRNQLQQINDGNRIYIVFVDEFDTKIPSRTGDMSQGYKNDVIGEFLRFRGDGDYINKGNYIVIATTNDPSNIDPAIMRVFNFKELPGPLSASEKVKVLYNNLLPGIQKGYVTVDKEDWEPIGKMLVEYDLMGGNIVNIARQAREKYRKISSKLGDNSYNLRATEVEGLVGEVISQGDFSDYISTGTDIIQSIMKEAEKVKNERKKYLGGRQEQTLALTG
ncbi:AAA family ATPase [Candidatus Woesearchaeota archaeon]|nr:AAA family ATPase [Candidatus Woesearchaeota archaeon]